MTVIPKWMKYIKWCHANITVDEPTGATDLPPSFHCASPPDCHDFLAGDWLSQKAMVVATPHPALVTDAARAGLQEGRGLGGSRPLQLLQRRQGTC